MFKIKLKRYMTRTMKTANTLNDTKNNWNKRTILSNNKDTTLNNKNET